jgi:hypothetical protein
MTPSDMTNIFLFDLVGLTDILYSVYVPISVCLDRSGVSGTVSVWWCNLLFEGSNPHEGDFFFLLSGDESISIYLWQDVKIHYAPLNYLSGTTIVFEALYGIILCRSTWTCRGLKLYHVKYCFLISIRLFWFIIKSPAHNLASQMFPVHLSHMGILGLCMCIPPISIQSNKLGKITE